MIIDPCNAPINGKPAGKRGDRAQGWDLIDRFGPGMGDLNYLAVPGVGVFEYLFVPTFAIWFQH